MKASVLGRMVMATALAGGAQGAAPLTPHKAASKEAPLTPHRAASKEAPLTPHKTLKLGPKPYRVVLEKPGLSGIGGTTLQQVHGRGRVAHGPDEPYHTLLIVRTNGSGHQLVVQDLPCGEATKHRETLLARKEPITLVSCFEDPLRPPPPMPPPSEPWLKSLARALPPDARFVAGNVQRTLDRNPDLAKKLRTAPAVRELALRAETHHPRHAAILHPRDEQGVRWLVLGDLSAPETVESALEQLLQDDTKSRSRSEPTR